MTVNFAAATRDAAQKMQKADANLFTSPSGRNSVECGSSRGMLIDRRATAGPIPAGRG